jgi:hypothetical protein
MMKCLQRPGRFPHIFLFNLKTWARSLHQKLVAIVKKNLQIYHGMALSLYQLTQAGEGGNTLIHTCLEYSFSKDNLLNLSLPVQS